MVLLVAMTALTLPLIPRFGAVGAALGTAANFAGVNLLHSLVIWRHDHCATVGLGWFSRLRHAVAGGAIR